MKHDPLCPTHRSNSAWLIRPRDCDYCKVITKAREDERAKCIAALSDSQAATYPSEFSDGYDLAYAECRAALRATQTP